MSTLTCSPTDSLHIEKGTAGLDVELNQHGNGIKAQTDFLQLVVRVLAVPKPVAEDPERAKPGENCLLHGLHPCKKFFCLLIVCLHCGCHFVELAGVC